MLKKDGTLRLYINYRELNNITVKNIYLLLLILNLQDRLQEVKWFTKLNISKAYNQIRMLGAQYIDPTTDRNQLGQKIY